MSYYVTCPLCNANLDPGERCECQMLQESRRIAQNSAFYPKPNNRHHPKQTPVLGRFSGKGGRLHENAM